MVFVRDIPRVCTNVSLFKRSPPIFAGWLLLLVAFYLLLHSNPIWEHGAGADGLIPASEPGLATDGRPWRLGEPFQPLQLGSVHLTFRTNSPFDSTPTSKKNLPENEGALLFYAQQLNGVFHPKAREYVAVTLTNRGIDVTYRRRSGGAGSKPDSRSLQTSTVSTKGNFHDGAWYTLRFTLLASQMIVVAKQGQYKPNGAGRKGGIWSSTFQSSAAADAAMEVDSGIYIGGVIDPMTLTMSKADYAMKLVPFSGTLGNSIWINGERHKLETQRRVLPDHIVESYYLGHDLKQNIYGKVPRERLDMNHRRMKHFPVLGAVSDDHVEETTDMIMSVAKTMNERGVLIYDLGLTPGNIVRMNSYCNVTVRSSFKLNFRHLLTNLYNMRWKPLIIQSVLMEFGGVLYTDASIRYRKSILDIAVLRDGYGFVGFGPSGTSPTDSFTHDGTFASLGVTRRSACNATLTIGGIQIWVDVPGIRDYLLPQWVACALSKECMDPKGAALFGCQINQTWKCEFIGCHRYDQSAISVILWKAFRDKKAASYQVNDPVDLTYASIERAPTKHNPMCMRTD